MRITKKLITSLTLVCALLFLTSCEKETLLSEQDIPSEIKSFVSTHFPNCTISKAIKENDENDEAYEITLSCGVTLEFDKHIKVIDIDGTSRLPDSVIPHNILSYVNSNYAPNYILGWEILSNNQKVQLNNGLVLVFNMAGDFLRVDG
ncbi:MAG: PepSY-like domain-containing protein [Ferruginibacter sp.]|nr:PepSY-like domain-containing protein [Ferruginibacter sp.]